MSALRSYGLWCALASMVYLASIYAADIGSDTAVNRFDTLQVLQDGDRIAGFAALDEGFVLAGEGVTGTFDSFFPVSGLLSLNFGTLSLNQDLIFHNEASIYIAGNILGNNHNLEFSRSIKCIPEQSGADLCSITFTHDHISPDTVTSVDFSYDDLYLVHSYGTNISVEQVINENYLQAAGSQNIGQTVYAVAWHPLSDYIAVGAAGGAGAELYIYSYNRGTHAFTLTDSKDFGGVGNAINSLDWHPDGDYLAIGSSSNTQTIVVYAFSAGTLGASATIAFNTDCHAVAWNASGSYLATGFDVLGAFDELKIYSFAKGSPPTLTLNASRNTGAAIASIAWNNTASADGEFVAGLSGGTGRLRLYRHDGGAGTITRLDDSEAPASTTVNSVTWHPDEDCIAAGLQNNSEGNGGELRVYHFVDDAIIEVDAHEITDNVLSVAWSPNGRLLAIGTEGVGGANPLASLYWFDEAFIDTSIVTFDNVNIFMNGNATYDFTAIKFTGESSICGRGNIISFSPTFSIIVGENSSLLFKRITMSGMNSEKLRLTDATSTVSFEAVQMKLDEDFYFDTGCFEVLDQFIISGDHAFIYQSPCTSTILSREPGASSECAPGYAGRMVIDANCTFSYDTTLSSTLIHLEEEYAQLVFNSASLAVTSSLQLINGRLFFDGKCTVKAGEGLIFGDGIGAHNLLVEILPAARLDVESGFLIDMNL